LLTSTSTRPNRSTAAWTAMSAALGSAPFSERTTTRCGRPGAELPAARPPPSAGRAAPAPAAAGPGLRRPAGAAWVAVHGGRLLGVHGVVTPKHRQSGPAPGLPAGARDPGRARALRRQPGPGRRLGSPAPAARSGLELHALPLQCRGMPSRRLTRRA